MLVHHNVGTSECAIEADLASLKSEIDKLDIGILETTPVDLIRLSDLVKNEVLKNQIFKLLKAESPKRMDVFLTE